MRKKEDKQKLYILTKDFKKDKAIIDALLDKTYINSVIYTQINKISGRSDKKPSDSDYKAIDNLLINNYINNEYKDYINTYNINSNINDFKLYNTTDTSTRHYGESKIIPYRYNTSKYKKIVKIRRILSRKNKTFTEKELENHYRYLTRNLNLKQQELTYKQFKNQFLKDNN